MDKKKHRIILFGMAFFLLGIILVKMAYVKISNKEGFFPSVTDKEIKTTSSKFVVPTPLDKKIKENLYGKEPNEKGFLEILGVVEEIDNNKITVRYSENKKNTEVVLIDDNTRILKRPWFMNPAKGDKFMEANREDIKKGDQVEMICEQSEKTGVILAKSLLLYK